MQNILTFNLFLIYSLNKWSLEIIFYYSLAIQTHGGDFWTYSTVDGAFVYALGDLFDTGSLQKCLLL